MEAAAGSNGLLKIYVPVTLNKMNLFQNAPSVSITNNVKMIVHSLKSKKVN